MSFSRTSGVFRTIVRCLASDEGLSHLNDIEIYVYKSRYGNYTNAIAIEHGKKLNWISESVPPVMYRKVDGTTVPDYTLRNEWVEKLVERINEAAKHPIPLDAPSLIEIARETLDKEDAISNGANLEQIQENRPQIRICGLFW